MASRQSAWFLTSFAAFLLTLQAANAQEAVSTPEQFANFIPKLEIANSWIMLIVFTGAFAFAMWSATWLIRERKKLDETNRTQALDIADLKARNERAQALLNVPDQRIVVWANREEAPLCRGTLPAQAGAPEDATAFVAFGTWMTPSTAQSFEKAVNRLRDSAEAFDLTIESKTGSIIEAQGRASGSHAFVRFINLSGDRAALAALESEHTKLLQTTDTMKSLLEAVPFPVWLKDENGHLSWANNSYVEAVETKTLDEVLDKEVELLDASERLLLAKQHGDVDVKDGPSQIRMRVPATVLGDRRTMDVSEVAYSSGSAGLAVDMSEVEEAQGVLRRTLESHAQTMDQLASAVAIFDEKKHLVFRNEAFNTLWKLDEKALDQQPENGALFDMLRSDRKVAEQPDWAKWRNSLLEVYEATQPQEHWWHLPDGRTLRVVANPHKQGGVTWVFENITEQLEMESRYIALTQVQGETLDHLVEAIAVFSADGRMKLSNPSFQNLWELEDEQVAAETPISDIAKLCKRVMDIPTIWDDLATGVTGVSDTRKSMDGRIELTTGEMIDYALVPLPNGQTMLSFADVTASVNLEHTLKERNEALQAAERLKNEFIEHVSYEFRAPLTNIKGFAEILEQNTFGKLNEKQTEYVNYISTSSNELHSLVDNLLDLATVDAGIMELDLKSLDLLEVMNIAGRSVSDQVKERGVKLILRHDKNVGSNGEFVGDETRVQQVLLNLLSNAISFSPEKGSVILESSVDADNIFLKVHDSGPGISPEDRTRVFQRFSSKTQGSGRGGAGLGLSIAKSLIELHGGDISISDGVEKGTCFICRFPKRPAAESTSTAQAAQ